MISICMIVKNEEKIIEECLQHLIPYGYEIVITDTGSTDNTKKIALKYTDKVYDYDWEQDFASARNFTAHKANNKYILFIDSDEIVTSFNKQSLEELVKKNHDAIGRLLIRNEYTRRQERFYEQERLGRLFSKEKYEYMGKIHEQLVQKCGDINKYYDIPIVINHKGYDGDITVRSKKAERNIQLLMQEINTIGEEPYILYQLGKSYYMKEEYTIACEWYEKALNYDLNPQLEFVQDMVESYGYSLLETKRYTDAMLLLNVYDDFAVSADYVFLAGLILMNNGKFSEAVTEFTKATKITSYKVEGVNSYRANYNIGVIYECLGEIEMACKYYGKCGEYSVAVSRLNSLQWISK